MSTILDSALEEYFALAGAGRFAEALAALQNLLRLRTVALFVKAGIDLKAPPSPVFGPSEVDIDVWVADQARAIVEEQGNHAPIEISAALLTMDCLITLRQHAGEQPGEDRNAAGSAARLMLAGFELGLVSQMSELALSGDLGELDARMVAKAKHRETIRLRNEAAAPWHRPAFAMLAVVMVMAGAEKPTAKLARHVMAEMTKLNLLPKTRAPNKAQKEPVQDRALTDAVKEKADLWGEIRGGVLEVMAGRDAKISVELRSLYAEAIERMRASGEPPGGWMSLRE